jgi:hypothetical protein
MPEFPILLLQRRLPPAGKKWITIGKEWEASFRASPYFVAMTRESRLMIVGYIAKNGQAAARQGKAERTVGTETAPA